MSGSPYDELLIKHGLALIGPGDPGKWTSDRSDERLRWRVGSPLRHEPQAGDVVLLRIGSDRVVAVGIIASDYEYLEQFDDVHGWDLQHARRVRWRVLPESRKYFPAVYSEETLKGSRG